MALKFSRKVADVVPADDSLVYEILTDYDSYTEWIPYFAASKLLAEEGDLAIAEFDVPGPPKDKWTVECIHDRNSLVLGRRIGGAAPISKVEWRLASAEPGHCRVALTIEALVSWRWLLPAYWKILDASALLRGLRTQLSTFLPEVAMPGEEGEMVLQLTESSEGLVLWLRGKKYILQEAPEEKS